LVRKKLTYIYHNPNGVTETAEHILSILMTANKAKIDAAIYEASISTSGIINVNKNNMFLISIEEPTKKSNARNQTSNLAEVI